MKTDNLTSLWTELRESKEYQTRIDPTHPLDFFAGVYYGGKDELILITDNEPKKMNSSKQIKIDKNKRNTDGRWATQIILENQDYSDVFSKLCLDLMDVTRPSTSEEEGLALLTSRFMSWQKMFKAINELMSESVIKGMIGELKLALDKLSKQMTWPSIIEAWMGPEGGDRDYVFDDTWYEVKAIATGKPFITISSINQLEVDCDGRLTVYNVDKSNSRDKNAFSVGSLIKQVRQNCKSDPYALQILDNKLLMLGYYGQSEYDELFYTCSGPVYYEVNSSFPKLTNKNVSTEIVDVRYDILLPSIEKWRVDE